MKENFVRFTIRTDPVLMEKLTYIAKYECRTKNKEIAQLIKKRIQEFEQEHGTIEQRGQAF